MRILYLTQWFEPEPNIVKGIAFVRALENAGHAVTVVTGFPNYPTGRIYPGYRLRWIQHERIDGVEPGGAVERDAGQPVGHVEQDRVGLGCAAHVRGV